LPNKVKYLLKEKRKKYIISILSLSKKVLRVMENGKFNIRKKSRLNTDIQQ